jgi:hypothetical protein
MTDKNQPFRSKFISRKQKMSFLDSWRIGEREALTPKDPMVIQRAE